jgi:proteasome lid subunit RPN8/RPN11
MKLKNPTNNVLSALIAYNDDRLPFNREISCFVIPNKGIISMTTNNSAGGVEFDFFHIWEQIKKMEERPNYVYMIHTHPPYLNKMSDTDENMIEGWAMALGIPIFIIVVTPENLTAYLCQLEKQGSHKTVLKQFYADIDLTNHREYIAHQEICILAKIMYGLSKLEPLPNEDLNIISNYINDSGLVFP